MQKFIIRVTTENMSLISDDKAECFLLDSSADGEFNRSFAVQAKQVGKLVLATGDNSLELCKELELDGVIVDLSKNEKPKDEFCFLRRFLGSKVVIGAITRNRRHEAMVISEFEPDFLVFQAWNDGIEPVRELVAWYNELFLIQSAVICREENVDFRSFDCDIVILSDREYTIFVAKKQRLD